MRLKRIIANDMAHALRIIKSELGDNAVILSTRKITDAEGKKTLEITAALDGPAPSVVKTTPFADVLPRAGGAEWVRPQHLGSKQAESLLQQHGLDQATVTRLQKAMQALGDTGFSTPDALEMVLSKMLRFMAPAQALPQRTPVVFVGPTGAGKTTTLAKLAVKAKAQKKTVGLFTLDTYKIGAIEQFDIYAQALGEEPRVIREASALPEALRELADRDYIFIDTPGVNPFEKTRLNGLHNILAPAGCHVALVLPANLNLLELNSLPKAFADLGLQSIIFSKLDETAQLGGLVNAALGSGLGVCYATDGQRVPHDLLELDPASLAKRLLTAPRLPWEAPA